MSENPVTEKMYREIGRDAGRKAEIKWLRAEKRRIAVEGEKLDGAVAAITAEMARRRGAGYYLQRFPS